MKIHAVITGDIIDSSKIRGDYLKTLSEIAQDIKIHQDPNFLFETFRGDSFQGLISDPAKALFTGILIRAGLRRNITLTGIENIWDARISIGIGEVNNFEVTAGPRSETRLSTLDGEAFVQSGRGLDTMKSEGIQLKIITSDDQLNKDFAAMCPLVDAIVSRWNTTQAEVIYLHLLRNLTQKEIGDLLGKSQRAIGKRLESSDINSMNNLFLRYKEVMTWKYNN